MKSDLLNFLTKEKDLGKVVVGYGAAAKGNTFLNYAGVNADLIEFVVDAAQAKQSKFLPGSHIPIYSPEALVSSKPDVVLILPWNIADEVLTQNLPLLEQGCEFYVAVPTLKKLS
jgi:ABC-type Fe3+-hydroxamate transport system substrate-binding protein